MKRIAMLTLIMILTFLTQIYAQDKIALTLKSRGEIALKRSREANFKPNLAIGTPLFSEDHIKTGNDGYAVLVFLDDKSQIKIRENSEMIIRGQRGSEAISKNISMSFGTLKAEISPQRKGDFVIATPTSVASVKGTVFWVQSDPVNGDVFYGLSGQIEVTNNESGATIVVGANQTGISKPSGDVDLQQTQQGTAPVETEEETVTPANVLRIQLRNAAGETKELKIEY
jgi:hypothetical protein